MIERENKHQEPIQQGMEYTACCTLADLTHQPTIKANDMSYSHCSKCGHQLSSSADDFMNGLCSLCKAESVKVQPLFYGWICPRCGVVHSPFSTQCNCPPPVNVSTGASTDI